MIITLSDGKNLRGDLIKLAVLRNDLAPIPATLHAIIRIDDGLQKLLTEGKIVAANGDKFYIVKAKVANNRQSQGAKEQKSVEIMAFLDNVHTAGFVRKTAIVKEKITLSEIYRATGATLKTIDSDFAINRFYCYSGSYPTALIAQALQEQGGVVRWKNGKLSFVRLQDLFKQKPIMSLPDNAMSNTNSGFLERHEIPTFYSTDDSGQMIYGNQDKTRKMQFVPHKNLQQLQNMGRCLVHRKKAQIAYDLRIAGGDLIDIQGAKPLAIVTACHVFESGSDGTGSEQYSQLYLSSLEG